MAVDINESGQQPTAFPVKHFFSLRRGGKLLSTSHPGSGVGLLSVQTAVDRYQGRLSLETEDHTFRVSILLNV